MSTIAQTMYDFFQNSKLEGSYLLLFAISIVLLYTINENRHRWLSLYPVVVLAVVVINPFTIWLLSLIFPVTANYNQISVLLPILIYIPFAATELISSLKTHSERVSVGIILFLFISICGNLFGIFGGNTMIEANRYTDERKELVAYADEVAKKGGIVLADDELLPFLTAYGDNIPLLYGQDMMMFTSDLGIMDIYDEGIIEIHNMMWTPDTTFDLIADMAESYGCDIIMLKQFDNARVFVGGYKLTEKTDNYLIYRLR